MARGKSAPQKPTTEQPVVLSPWDLMAFKPLREVAKIADPEERRLAALDRLLAIQKGGPQGARPRAGTVHNRIVYDPDGNTLLKAEELVHSLLAIEPAKPALPDSESVLE